MANARPDVPQASQDTASLLKRLAGPSVTKAGLAKDQTEINRIIAEVSKGSKFYENEKRKDKELTEKISGILKIKDKIMKEADIQRVEADADKLLEELELERDLSQTIVHVDMDAFFANVAVLSNPDLEGKPFGVGGGVLSTASYEARKYGVRSGMASFVAKKLCPDLILLPVKFKEISEISRKVMDIFKEYDPNMIVAGCDEGYLNITSYCATHGLSAEECISAVRERVAAETRITVSAGIAPNKMLAKICSDKNKPNGQFLLPFEKDAIRSFMHDLSIRKLPGVGRVHERLLDSIGVKTCGDIYTHRAVIWLMDQYFWKTFLYSAYLGIASNVVEPHQREERKSIGAERTFQPLKDTAKIIEKLEEVAIELENDMRENGWAGKTVTLKYKLDTFQNSTRAKSFNRWITKKDDLFNTGKELLKPELPLCVRLIGLRVSKLKDLRAPEDQGIKRFFQTGTAEQTESFPKKRKLAGGTHTAIDVDADANDFQLLVEQEEDAEQDFFKMEEEGFQTNEADELSKMIQAEPEAGPSKLAAATHPAMHPPPENLPPSPKVEEASAQPCPLCGKEFDARDNLGLNAHIDFCLSKDVIMQASASASPGSQSRVGTNGGAERPRGEKRKARADNRTLNEWDWKGMSSDSKMRKGKR